MYDECISIAKANTTLTDFFFNSAGALILLFWIILLD